MKSFQPLILFFLLFLTVGSLSAQDKYWVFFEDKGPESAQWMTWPEQLLSPRALKNRARKGIELDTKDLPVSETYLSQLKDDRITLHGASKWLNAASITTDYTLTELQTLCPVITGLRTVNHYMKPASLPFTDEAVPPITQKTQTTFDYGAAYPQNHLIGADALHDMGFAGEGVLVAIFDAGFYSADTLKFFDSLWVNNRIKNYWDFVDQDSLVFRENVHGLGVFSVMASNIPGELVGTAPHADYILARTEDVYSETHQEEDNWVLAMEWADSQGVQLIQSSLGYSTFDQGEGDYTYQDLDGETAIITRAADIAASRGILVVTSGGNEGNGSWHWITVPCDGDSVLCVGSVDTLRQKSNFSSWGPRPDGMVKPDVMGMGDRTAVTNFLGSIRYGNGTSFAAPGVAGMAACLIQAHPDRSNMELIQAIRQSSDRYATPDSGYGYGIPNARIADSILTVMDSLALAAEPDTGLLLTHFKVYPNPAKDELTLENISGKFGLKSISLSTLMGHGSQIVPVEDPAAKKIKIPMGKLSAGMYILRVETKTGETGIFKFLKH